MYFRICSTPTMLSMLPSYTGSRECRCSLMKARTALAVPLGVYCGHVHARRQDRLHRQLRELQRRAHELAPPESSVRLVRHVLDDVVELIFRHGDLRVPLRQIR